MKENNRKINWQDFRRFVKFLECQKAEGLEKRVGTDWLTSELIVPFHVTRCSEKLLEILSLANEFYYNIDISVDKEYINSTRGQLEFNEATIFCQEFLTALYRYSKSENLALENNLKILKAELEDLIQKDSKGLFLLRCKQLLNSYFWTVLDETIKEMTRKSADFKIFVENWKTINELSGDLADLVSLSKLLKKESEAKKKLRKILAFKKERVNEFFYSVEANLFKNRHSYKPSKTTFKEKIKEAAEKMDCLNKKFKNPENIFSNNYNEEMEEIFKEKLNCLKDIEVLETKEVLKAKERLEKIYDFIQREKQITAKELAKKFKKSLKWAYNQLNKLIEKDYVEKDKKFYRIKK